jgi:hypothetical protein
MMRSRAAEKPVKEGVEDVSKMSKRRRNNIRSTSDTRGSSKGEKKRGVKEFLQRRCEKVESASRVQLIY